LGTVLSIKTCGGGAWLSFSSDENGAWHPHGKGAQRTGFGTAPQETPEPNPVFSGVSRLRPSGPPMAPQRRAAAWSCGANGGLFPIGDESKILERTNQQPRTNVPSQTDFGMERLPDCGACRTQTSFEGALPESAMGESRRRRVSGNECRCPGTCPHLRPSGPLRRFGVSADQRRTIGVVAGGLILRAATTPMARRRPAS